MNINQIPLKNIHCIKNYLNKIINNSDKNTIFPKKLQKYYFKIDFIKYNKTLKELMYYMMTL